MTDLHASLERLVEAIGRLEQAVEDRDGRERSLAEDVRAARAGQEAAEKNAEEISRRLEAAIGRLEAVLES